MYTVAAEYTAATTTAVETTIVTAVATFFEKAIDSSLDALLDGRRSDRPGSCLYGCPDSCLYGCLDGCRDGGRVTGVATHLSICSRVSLAVLDGAGQHCDTRSAPKRSAALWSAPCRWEPLRSAAGGSCYGSLCGASVYATGGAACKTMKAVGNAPPVIRDLLAGWLAG